MKRLPLNAALLGGAVVVLSVCTRVEADVVLNPSFEADSVAYDTWIYSASGWIATGDAGTFRPPVVAYPSGAPVGGQVGFVQSGWGRPTGILSQTLSIPLTAGETYTLSALIGRRIDNPLLPWGGYIMSMWAGDALLAQDNTGVHPDAGQFMTSTLSYTVTEQTPNLGGLLTIRFESLFGQTNIDDVQVKTVPCPAAWLSLGLAMVARRRSR